MKKTDFIITKQNNVETIKYELKVSDVYDDNAAEKAAALSNIISFDYTDVDGKRAITAYAHEDINLESMLKKVLHKKDVLCLLSGLTSLFEMGAQGIPVSYFVKDFNFIYVNAETYAVKCVVIPVKQDVMPLAEIPAFFREVISKMRFSEFDTDNYVAKLISEINADDFSVSKLKANVDAQLEGMGLFISKDNGLVNMTEDKVQQPAKDIKVNKLGVMNNMRRPQMPQQPMMGQPVQQVMGQPKPALQKMLPLVQQVMGQPQPALQQMQQQVQQVMGQPQPALQQMQQPVQQVMGQPQPASQQIPKPVPPMMGQPQQIPQPVAPMMGQPQPVAPEAPKPVPPMMGQPHQVSQQIPQPVAPEAPKPVQQVMGQPQQVSQQIPKPVAPEAPKPVQQVMEQPQQVSQQIPKPVPPMPNPAMQTAPKTVITGQIMANSAKPIEEGGEPNATVMVNNGPGALQPGITGQIGTKPIPHFVRKNTGEIINITKPEFSIGKSKTKADYAIENNTAISRVHCIVVQRDGVNYIKDNNSTNHTFINGIQLEPGKEVLLKNKAIIRMGDEEFTFLLRKGE